MKLGLSLQGVKNLGKLMLVGTLRRTRKENYRIWSQEYLDFIIVAKVFRVDAFNPMLEIVLEETTKSPNLSFFFVHFKQH